jgi:hypothetical protein
MSDVAIQAQIEWAHTYDGYRRLASSPEKLEKLLHSARNSFASRGRVPAWCGVDFLRGWAFYLVRADRHMGGGSLTVEWDAVFAAIVRHPDATTADRPPQRGPRHSAPTEGLPITFSSAPRAHKDPNFLAAKKLRLREPHVAAINDFVDQIVCETGADVPYIDPDSGGIAARVLFVLQAPARAAAHGSGMLSADNDDGTAANIWQGYADSGMPRTFGLHWNAVPWYVGTREKLGPIGATQVDAGRRWLASLLRYTPDLLAVISFGLDAKQSVTALKDVFDARGIAHLHSIHPSPRNFNSRRERTIREVSTAFGEALRIAEGGLSND